VLFPLLVSLALKRAVASLGLQGGMTSIEGDLQKTDATTPDPRVQWELAFELDGMAEGVLRARCDITDLTVSEGGPGYLPPPAVVALQRRLLDEGGSICVFDGAALEGAARENGT
jgi:hypothetical protein